MSFITSVFVSFGALNVRLLTHPSTMHISGLGNPSWGGGPSWALWDVEHHPWPPIHQMPGAPACLAVTTTDVPRCCCQVSPGVGIGGAESPR